ncbi:hypothetical protein TSOC_008963 [Tetrabaena socialis]|uniref:Uncharacterized protein n=1 Tax=Tetrabaena socialis TaxID=47790 RepID=A0A2J7ZXA8_9CHLO|nr:hypothetical protein TSOC_008963 [Tetrabaena socialis]|eukprot:PNH04911.1 hypothetical protein TSOC_008963 [Tetrabaena socialis]
MLVHKQAVSVVRPAHRRAALPLAQPSQSNVRCRAEPTETPAAPKPAPAAPAPAESAEVKKDGAGAPLLQKGQGTAIVTGAISTILGVGYLVLVWFMDSRGGQMLPPPPEAFGP